MSDFTFCFLGFLGSRFPVLFFFAVLKSCQLVHIKEVSSREYAPDPDGNAISRIRPNQSVRADIHVDVSESNSVLWEKRSLFPEGCYILAEGDMIAGFLLSHPWKRHDPPPLDNLLGWLPPRPDTYYIHDLALAESAGGMVWLSRSLMKL